MIFEKLLQCIITCSSEKQIDVQKHLCDSLFTLS